MSIISVRQIQEEDAMFLHNFMNDKSILKALNEAPTTYIFWENAIIDWNNDDDEEDYIILLNNHPAGWFGINNLSSENKQVFLKMITILPGKQGLGIGVSVVGNLLTDLKSRGFKSIALYTNCNNIAAQKCYRKCGFTIKETVTQKMSNGDYVERYKMAVSFKKGHLLITFQKT